MTADPIEHPRPAPDVMLQLRTATATEHQQLEDTLDLLDPGLTPARLIAVLGRMHAFWTTAEAGLDAWAAARPDDAADVDWSARRRSDLFAADLDALDAPPGPGPGPHLPAPASTAEALGTMYVLEGSTLGGVFIDRHLGTLPALAGVGRLSAFSPYGDQTGARWASFRRSVRDHVARGGDPDALVAAARRTFATMALWCTDVEQPASRAAGRPTDPGDASA
ncbi:Heme oxygenase [Klenkia soli]|uniref:Heme oxygenase n=1 Tax=Klenkia soli TaxID=1052260 RepID=A0A1H0KBZ4_9ACTN|nr:biliverdin-producing heme oxygenase [Klenkia soli]SDO53467.1 Heme oxygenase [Klenkia soli]